MSKKKANELENKRIMGVWDLGTLNPKLGSLLVFIEQLKIQQFVHKADYIDLCFIGDAGLTAAGNKEAGRRNGQLSILDKESCGQSLFIKTLFDIDAITSYYQCDSLSGLEHFLSNSSYDYRVWTSKDGQVILNYDFDNTFVVQDFFKKYFFIPYLSCRLELIEWAKNFFRSHVSTSMPVVVHLKNNPAEQHCSNADFDAWFAFFEACLLHYDVKFVLIGNERIDERIYSLPNIVIARDFESNLSRDLALIQKAAIYMGMASGPFQMALFSDIPYAIYKNPDHHAEAMRLELGTKDRYPFATPLQKIFRVVETKENLLSNFDSLYADVNRYYGDKRRIEAGSLQ
jgi:hypothetical protein